MDTDDIISAIGSLVDPDVALRLRCRFAADTFRLRKNPRRIFYLTAIAPVEDNNSEQKRTGNGRKH